MAGKSRSTVGLRVLESFQSPRATTNPYIVQLLSALEATPGLVVEPFSWKAALTQRYDVFHVHWPHTLLQGRNRLTRWGKTLASAALLVRLRVTGTAVVRTVHNESPHERNLAYRYLDRAIDRITTLRIHLNPADTRGPDSVLIPHGDFREWYARFPKAPATPGRLAFVGMIRPYKGVEDLLAAFRALSQTDSSATLTVSGHPLTPDYGRELAEGAAGTPVELELTFLDDASFVNRVTRSQGVVLPYARLTNSGVALAALSLDRPVLMPRVPSAVALQTEVGRDWVHLFEGTLSADDLAKFLKETATTDGKTVEFRDRSWERAGEQHAAAFRTAVGACPRKGRLS